MIASDEAPLRRLQEFRFKQDFSIAADPGFCHSLGLVSGLDAL
jgi:hypothetical protein